MNICKCGCGGTIEPKRHHKARGVPEYLRGHNPASKPQATKAWIIRNGYRCILTGIRTYTYEHRMVMEQTLGRPLRPGELVHHRDHNRLNNDPANLELTTYREHGRHHHPGGEDKRTHVHKHYGCECGQSTGLSDEWREANEAQRDRDLTRDKLGRISKR